MISIVYNCNLLKTKQPTNSIVKNLQNLHIIKVAEGKAFLWTVALAVATA